jgi:hypothetical protein
MPEYLVRVYRAGTDLSELLYETTCTYDKPWALKPGSILTPEELGAGRYAAVRKVKREASEGLTGTIYAEPSTDQRIGV